MMNVFDQVKRRFHCVSSIGIGSFAVNQSYNAAFLPRRSCYLQWQPSFHRTPHGHNVTVHSDKVNHCGHHHPIVYRL